MRNLLAFVAVSSLASIAVAQERLMRPLPGSKQLGVLGNWTSTSGASTHTIVFEGGYYVTESLVAVARLGFSKHSPERTAGYLGVRYELKASGMTVPYLTAGVEAHRAGRGSQAVAIRPRFVDTGGEGAIFEAGMGANFFLNTHVALFLEVVGFKEGGSSDVGTNLQIGLRAFFK